MLMNLIYRCKHLKLEDGAFVKRPLIPVTLIGRNDRLNFTAVLDSGSDYILLPLQVAEALGLDFDKTDADQANTYDGNIISTTKSKVRISIKKDREKQVFDCKCAVFLGKETKFEEIIFGSSFFEHLKILFDYPHNKFQIKK